MNFLIFILSLLYNSAISRTFYAFLSSNNNININKWSLHFFLFLHKKTEIQIYKSNLKWLTKLSSLLSGALGGENMMNDVKKKTNDREPNSFPSNVGLMLIWFMVMNKNKPEHKKTIRVFIKCLITLYNEYTEYQHNAKYKNSS